MQNDNFVMTDDSAPVIVTYDEKDKDFQLSRKRLEEFLEDKRLHEIIFDNIYSD